MKKRREKAMPLMVRIPLYLIAAVLLCILFLMGYVTLQESRISRNAADVPACDAIIVLGAQVKADGTPSVQLSWRLNAAAEAWKKSKVPVVVCGAQGADEPFPEAEAMRRYLMEEGVPEDMIRMDAESHNTKENINNAKKLLGETAAGKVLIVSSDYHVPRAMALARDAGLEAEGLGSPCKQEFWFKNHFREGLAWAKYWLVKYFHLSL